MTLSISETIAHIYTSHLPAGKTQSTISTRITANHAHIYLDVLDLGMHHTVYSISNIRKKIGKKQ